MWEIAAACDKYRFDHVEDRLFRDLGLRQWFAEWVNINKNNIEDCRQLLYPAFKFDHAKVFAQHTKWLSYNHVGPVDQLCILPVT